MNRYPALMTIWLLSCIMAGAGLWACRSGKTSEKNSSVYNQTTIAAENKISKKQKIILDTPKNNQTFQIGEAITVKYSKRPVSFVFDSCQLFFDNDPVASYLKGENNLYIVTDTLNPGNHKISLIAYVNGKSTPRSSVNVTLLSDITPQLLGYKIINIYPHDRKAYTQGLVYENGFLYEGTGLKGKSSLRKVNLQTGEPVASLNLPPDLFGEGICILDNRIIQLTWTSGLGFVYDKNSFRFLNKIRYNTQGWGLTTDGTSLIMSDGSNHLYFIEPTYFSETSRIEVFDNKGAVNNLNELEYINGLVYANIYQTNKIAIIDPRTGKVIAYLNLSGLLKKKDRESTTDVLNGIAWDPASKNLFVTGKNWPKLFEIKTIPR